MSTPIKGPGGAAPGAGLPEAEGPSGTKTEGTSESFRDALDKTGEPGQASASRTEASQVPAADPVTNVAADLRAGRIDVATALDRIVARAMESGPASTLPPAQRRELEAFLRQSLADDPSLLALTKDLERGR
jgi:hypothetical protein